MAVPALDPTNTERWFLDYTVGGYQHALICRTQDGADQADVEVAFDGLLNRLPTYLAEITVVGLRMAVRGSDVTNPRGIAFINPTYGAGAQGAIYGPVQTSFTCRDTDGHKGRVSVFGAANLNDASFRIHATENSEIADAIDWLGSESASGFFLTINGKRGFFHAYANVGLNDHFVKDKRQGGGTA